jgi:hypothetical protein
MEPATNPLPGRVAGDNREKRHYILHHWLNSILQTDPLLAARWRLFLGLALYTTA